MAANFRTQPWTGFVDYKVFGPGSEEEQEIRRMRVQNFERYNFNNLKLEICQLFPILKNTNFNIYWKDQEGDMVKIASNKELETALNENVNKYQTIYTRIANTKKQTNDNVQTEFVHPTVTCNNCRQHPLYGFRYKCMVCFDYDLCVDCEKSQKVHSEHPMIRFSNSQNNITMRHLSNILPLL